MWLAVLVLTVLGTAATSPSSGPMPVSMRALLPMTSRGVLVSILLDVGALLAVIGQAHALARVIEPVLLRQEDLAAIVPGAVLLVGCTLGGRRACGPARS